MFISIDKYDNFITVRFSAKKGGLIKMSARCYKEINEYADHIPGRRTHAVRPDEMSLIVDEYCLESKIDNVEAPPMPYLGFTSCYRGSRGNTDQVFKGELTLDGIRQFSGKIYANDSMLFCNNARVCWSWDSPCSSPVQGRAAFIPKELISSVALDLYDYNGPIDLISDSILGKGNLRGHQDAVEILSQDSMKNNRINRIYRESLSRAFVASLLDKYYTVAGKKKAREGKLALKETKTIIDYIHENWKLNPGLQDIAKSADCSASNVSKIFKNTMGCTIIQYMNHIRFTESRVKVCTTRTPILFIANECGFVEKTSFEKSYKKIFGITPKKDRDRHRHCKK